MRRIIEDWANSKYNQGSWGKNTHHSAIKWGQRFASFAEKHFAIISIKNITKKV